MKLTIFILSLPVAMFICLALATRASDEFRMALFGLWILSGLFCFGWSFYISRRSRLLGWLCASVPMIQLIGMMWPVYSRT
jgi:hypothetical protein